MPKLRAHPYEEGWFGETERARAFQRPLQRPIARVPQTRPSRAEFRRGAPIPLFVTKDFSLFVPAGVIL